MDRAFEAAVPVAAPVAAFGGVPWRTGGANRWVVTKIRANSKCGTTAGLYQRI